MMEFLLLSLKSVCMIAIRVLTGMQLISNEEKMLRWQTHGVTRSAHSRRSSAEILSSPVALDLQSLDTKEKTFEQSVV